MAEDLLVVSGVVKGFGGILAVDDVSLTVAAGEIVGLVGPNGAGKTTLFNCVSGMVRQDAGTISFDGVVLDHLPVFRRARLGIGRTFQRVEVFPELSVRDHLLVADRAHRRQGHLWKDLVNRSAPTREELDRADETMELVGLTELADVPVAALGLGSCRLVEVARALMTEPRLLLADEPSSGLDGHETHELAAVLRAAQRRRGLAVLLVEHDLGMVGDVVDRTVVLDLGRVLAEGSFDAVMADPVVRQAYLGVSA